MNNGLKYGLIIGGVIGIGLSTWFVIDAFNKNKDQGKREEEEKKKAEEALAAAQQAGTVTVTPPVINTSNAQPTVTNTQTAITGNVGDAVLKYTDKQLVGKKVYAAYNGLKAYTVTGKVYTTPVAGQLMGTYSHSKVLVFGGKNVYIKTTDPKAPYIWMNAKALKF